jgi:hypothetical protein
MKEEPGVEQEEVDDSIPKESGGEQERDWLETWLEQDNPAIYYPTREERKRFQSLFARPMESLT